jgi:hypothetical protein
MHFHMSWLNLVGVAVWFIGVALDRGTGGAHRAAKG